MGSKVFAHGEDTHSFRLESELSELQSGYVNLRVLRTLSSNQSGPVNKKDGRRGLVFGLARYSPVAKIPTPFVWKASFPSFSRGM